MTAKKAQTPRRRQKARKDSEEAITERNPNTGSAVPASDPSDQDPVTERRPQQNPALDGRAVSGHGDDDPVTRERVAEDTGGRGNEGQTSVTHGNDDPVTRERVAEDTGGRGSD